MDTNSEEYKRHMKISAEGWADAEMEHQAGERFPVWEEDMCVQSIPDHINGDVDRLSYCTGYELYWSMLKAGMLKHGKAPKQAQVEAKAEVPPEPEPATTAEDSPYERRLPEHIAVLFEEPPNLTRVERELLDKYDCITMPAWMRLADPPPPEGSDDLTAEFVLDIRSAYGIALGPDRVIDEVRAYVMFSLKGGRPHSVWWKVKGLWDVMWYSADGEPNLEHVYIEHLGGGRADSIREAIITSRYMAISRLHAHLQSRLDTYGNCCEPFIIRSTKK